MLLNPSEGVPSLKMLSKLEGSMRLIFDLYSFSHNVFYKRAGQNASQNTSLHTTLKYTLNS